MAVDAAIGVRTAEPLTTVLAKNIVEAKYAKRPVARNVSNKDPNANVPTTGKIVSLVSPSPETRDVDSVATSVPPLPNVLTPIMSP